ncbi:MAG TPA: preprotein translocase subunit YajC [Bacteroidota bacterium]|nr:preprotein translocase subunit YajC [Bacteroidota bacterium]
MTTAALVAFMAPSGGDAGSGMASTLIMFALIIGIFYFMILRPQQKRQKDRQKLLDALKKGDKVITAGGMYGTIAGIDDKTVLIQVADNVKMKFERSSVTGVVGDGTESKDVKKIE